jgi:hypothetical protein
MFNAFNFEQFIWLANQQIDNLSGEALDEYRFLLSKKLNQKDFEYTGFCMLPFELGGVALYALTCVFFEYNNKSSYEQPWWFKEFFFSQKNDFLSCLNVNELNYLVSIFGETELKLANNTEALNNLKFLLEQATFKEKLACVA